MRAIQLEKSIPRYVITKAIGRLSPAVFWSPLAMLQYRDVPEPQLPGPEWVRVRTLYGGICGSDMSAIFLKDSPVLTPLVSFPFTLGHENVGTIEELGPEVHGFSVGQRIVVDPILPCITRAIKPGCTYCQRGDYSLCQNFSEGNLSAGLSIGHCRDTGGSWSTYFVAHKSQLFPLPDTVSDESALLTDAFCTALHPVMRNFPNKDEQVLILGAGVVGLCTVLALRILGSQNNIIVVAKYPFQAKIATKYGADEVILLQEDDIYRRITEKNGGKVYQPALGKPLPVGGAALVFECVGSARSIDDSLRLASSAGTVVLVGLASIPKGVDWTPIWLNELRIQGSCWCSTESFGGKKVRTYQLALDWMNAGNLNLAEMLTHRFRLEDYKNALLQTSQRGRQRMLKSAFYFDQANEGKQLPRMQI